MANDQLNLLEPEKHQTFSTQTEPPTECFASGKIVAVLSSLPLLLRGRELIPLTCSENKIEQLALAWEMAYPHVDISEELKRISAWLSSNLPRASRTLNGLIRRINLWLSREEEKLANRTFPILKGINPKSFHIAPSGEMVENEKEPSFSEIILMIQTAIGEVAVPDWSAIQKAKELEQKPDWRERIGRFISEYKNEDLRPSMKISEIIEETLFTYEKDYSEDCKAAFAVMTSPNHPRMVKLITAYNDVRKKLGRELTPGEISLLYREAIRND